VRASLVYGWCGGFGQAISRILFLLCFTTGQVAIIYLGR
jgi:hypothetical protein